MQIDFAKVQEVLCESDEGIVPVDFTQIQRFFIKLPSIECVSISSKFKGVFCKIDVHKGSFAKLQCMDCGLISPKFSFFLKKS